MAKRKAASKKKDKKKDKKKPAPRRQPARQGILPGHEQVRNGKLDRLCESIGNTRDQMNDLRGEEKGDLQGALREMHDKNVVVYRHAGVELVRVPGEEKLRVRTTKEKASDITNDESATEPGGAGDQGAGDEGGGE